MEWKICLFSSCFVLILATIYLYFATNMKSKKKLLLSSFKVFTGFVFIAACILFVPIYHIIFRNDMLAWIKIILLSIHNTIRLFLVDGEFSIITDYIVKDPKWLYTVYSVYAAFLFVLAPILTFGIVLSFFKNISAYKRFVYGYFKDVYIFSELNKKSLALAESLKRNQSDRMVVFTDVFENNEEESYELVAKAREIGAVCFKKDIQVVNFRYHSDKKGMFFLVMGEDKDENIEQTLNLIKKYRDVKNTHLFVFATGLEGEMVLTSFDKGYMKVRRINEARSLTYRILNEHGEKIYKNAICGKKGKRHISAVIVGLGEHGTSMLKALSWYCQMDEYKLSINAFDVDDMAYEKLYTQCSELLSKEFKDSSNKEDAQYKIKIHSGVDVTTKSFVDKINKLKRITFVFVSLGNDAENIKVASYLRMLFERRGIKPLIYAVVHNSDAVDALKEIKNFKGQPYDIEWVGDLKTYFSEAVIMDSELEKRALKKHLKHGSEDDFWNYEYNYQSTLALLLHMKAREFSRIPGAGKSEHELTKEEKAIIESLEHRRWNAYMRSEGYIYSGSTDSSTRNDLGKMHHDLVKTSMLSEKERQKDSILGTK